MALLGSRVLRHRPADAGRWRLHGHVGRACEAVAACEAGREASGCEAAKQPRLKLAAEPARPSGCVAAEHPS